MTVALVQLQNTRNSANSPKGGNMTPGVGRREIAPSAESIFLIGARCSSVVRAFTHGAMGHRIDPSWGGSIELSLHDWCNKCRGM